MLPALLSEALWSSKEVERLGCITCGFGRPAVVRDGRARLQQQQQQPVKMHVNKVLVLVSERCTRNIEQCTQKLASKSSIGYVQKSDENLSVVTIVSKKKRSIKTTTHTDRQDDAHMHRAAAGAVFVYS